MQYVFYVTETGFRAYKSPRKADELIEQFAWDDIAQIELFISKLQTSASVMIVLDLVDEDLFFEWVPKVMPWEKSALLKRRKERLVSDKIALSEVHSTNQFRKSAEGRKEELILSATISDAFKLTRFLDNLEAAQILIKGIYSKPLLLTQYYRQVVRPLLGLTKDQENLPFLIISRQSKLDYRQTFFYEGEMRLSRPVEIEADDFEVSSIHKALLEETKLALTYVYNQKIIPSNAPIGLVFLEEDAAVLSNIEEDCRANGIIRANWSDKEFYFAAHTFREFSDASQYCIEEQGCYSEQSIVDFLFRNQVKGFYSTDYITRLRTFQVARKGLYGFNLALLAGGLAFVLVNSVDNFVNWQKLGLLDENIAAHQKEKQRLTELVKLQDDAQQIKASVEFSEAVLNLRVKRLIGFNIQGFSETVNRHPNIQLSTLDWRNVGPLDSMQHELTLNGWVFPFYDTYKNPVAWVDALVKDLQKLDGIESVSLDKEPLNRELKQAVRINTDQGEVLALPFSISLRLKDGQSK
ncbi:hypothetical protein THMIRHAS_19790 [Thiosulfatimonas sediminis]|uniref:Uncharacterized protein n=1 Tax=Thiosulfatimonas sediminis TaxID=2675054 RepID=A0A6F8PWY5_9GAMM|nr:hypothetical protein [Thiosulfatimonas sediminis]BBP46606.1 hypothetical protein THMIRHAS_19790 [Thiosulfatimonas sediminis]